MISNVIVTILVPIVYIYGFNTEEYLFKEIPKIKIEQEDKDKLALGLSVYTYVGRLRSIFGLLGKLVKVYPYFKFQNVCV